MRKENSKKCDNFNAKGDCMLKLDDVLAIRDYKQEKKRGILVSHDSLKELLKVKYNAGASCE